MVDVPIINIPIDDTALKAYAALVEKNKAQVDKLPKSWKEVGKATKEHQATVSKTTKAQTDTGKAAVTLVKTTGEFVKASGSALFTWRAMVRATSQVEDSIAKATVLLKAWPGGKGLTAAPTTAVVKAQQEGTQKQKEIKSKDVALVKSSDRFAVVATTAAQAWHSMSHDTKSVAAHILTATRALLRWASIIGAFSGLLGGGGLFGIDRLALSAGSARRSAQGFGVSASEQQALGINFGRYADTSSLLGNVAEARNDYTKRWAFAAMGVHDEQMRDPAQVSAEMLVRAKQIYDRGDQSQQQAQAHGLLEFFTMEDLRRLHNTPMSELQGSERDYARDRKALGLNDNVRRQWQDFSVQLHRAGIEIERVFIKGLVPLAPALEKLSASFTTAVSAFLSSPQLKEWIKDFAAGIHWLGDYMATDAFKQDVLAFANGIAKLASAIGSLAHWIEHFFPGASPAAAKTAGSSASTVNKYAIPSGPTVPKFGTDRYDVMEQTRAFWKSKGFTDAQVAGILAGGPAAESHFNPMAIGDNNTSYGLYQEHGQRLGLLFKEYGNHPTVAQQNQFAWDELHDPRFVRKGTLAALKAAKGSGEAAYAWTTGFERPKAGAIAAEARAKTAPAFLPQTLVVIENNTGGNAIVTASQLPR